MTVQVLCHVMVVCQMAAGPIPVGRAADFRVENSVFVGSDKKPAAQSSTIFHRGVVYDYLNEPAEVTVFDMVEGRFILLDVKRKLKTELTSTTVRQAIERLKRSSAASKDAKARFLYNPTFKQTVDEKTNELVFDSDWMTYRVLGTRVKNVEITRQYGQFSDWYARLNTFLRPGSRPPFPRLAVNEVLDKRGEMPSRIVLILKRRGELHLRSKQLRSEHRLIKRLLESDRRRVAQAGEQMAAFKEVSFREYETARKQ